MKRLGQKICVAAVLSLAVVAIWHDSASAIEIGSLGQIKNNSVVLPNRIDVDAAGTIYLSDGNVDGVTRYNKYGETLPTLKGSYHVTSNGVAVTPDGSRVFVSVGQPGSWNPTGVAVIDGSTGELIRYLGAGLGEFKRVVEIDLDGDGNIYVGNFDKAKTTTNLVNTAEVDVYSGTTYEKIGSFGKPASNLVSGYYLPLNGEFGEIAGLTVDVANREVLVAEGWNNNGISRVQIFGLDGTFKRNLPEATIAGTQVNCKPVGLTVDPLGRVYMLSKLTSTVHVFTTHPEAYLLKFTSGTPDPAYDATGKVIPWGPGMITIPSYDTVYDANTNRLYVVTDGNGIQIFSVDKSTNPVKANTAPQAPVVTSPAKESVVPTLTPGLVWSAAVDAENDPLTYNLQIVDAAGAVVSTVNGISTTSATVPAGLMVENKKFGWQVQANDGKLTSGYSAVESFWVNAVEEAPSAADLLSPLDAAKADKNSLFSWQAAVDADPLDTVSYKLEIAESADFSKPVVSASQAGLVSNSLATLPGYADMKPGQTYYWHVVAVDSKGLATASVTRTFVYASSVLTVDATFPDAKVFIGGNSAYSGRFVGVVPVELRDLDPGTLEIVVEKAGFEPYIQSIVVDADQAYSVNANLVVAILPAGLKGGLLTAAGLTVQASADAAPLAVDYDNDGITDLLVADGSGKLVLYKGVAEGKKAAIDGWELAPGTLLGVNLPAGAVPFVADWNNDGRKDLLVGAADGTVSVYSNIGTQGSPVFAAPVMLQADNAPLNVVSNAAPVVCDIDSNGAKDLLVGSGDGTIYKFTNIGTDEAPVFSAREVLIAAGGAANVSLLVTDWDADGSKDLLVASASGVAVYKLQSDGSYAKTGDVSFHTSMTVLGDKVRFVTVNADGIRGKDLLIGNAGGGITLASSTANKVTSISPLFDAALLESVAVIEEMIIAHGRSTAEVVSVLKQLKSNIGAKAANKLNYYFKAQKDLVLLQSSLKSDAEISALLAKLAIQLNSSIPLN